MHWLNNDQMLVMHWFNTNYGQMLINQCSNSGQTLIKHWSNYGQILIKYRSIRALVERGRSGLQAGPPTAPFGRFDQYLTII